MTDDTWAAVILTGGRGSRLGGVAKGDLVVEGRTFLARALAACAGAGEVVVVGDPASQPTDVAVRYVREQPPYAGPGAAFLTGIEALRGKPSLAVVLAVDMPLVTAETVGRLRRASAGHDGAVLIDGDGRRQLALVIRPEAATADAPSPAERQDIPFWRTLKRLDLIEVPAQAAEARDVDTWPDLEHVEQAARPDRPGRPER